MDKAEEKIIKAAAFIRLVCYTKGVRENFFTFISSLLIVCIITFRRKEERRKSKTWRERKRRRK